MKKLIPAGPLFSLFLSTGIFLASSVLAQQTQLPGTAIPQFVDRLPAIPVISARQSIELQMREFQAQVLSTGTLSAGSAPATWVWGYVPAEEAEGVLRNSYIGPVIVATRGTPIEIKYVNDLGSVSTSNLLAFTTSTDQTLHWADPLNGEANQCAMEVDLTMGAGTPASPECSQHYNASIPATVHLHGAEDPGVVDGNPDSWYTSDGLLKGSAFYSRDGDTATNYAIYRYPNGEESQPLWFHDHTLGITRLNVYAGLAGVYLLTDPPNDPEGLPAPVPLVIQDRMFDTNGQLFFPAGPAFAPNPQHPFWVPEFIGDTIVVNGRSWPYLEVEPKRYRFIIVNGSNARSYKLYLKNRGRAAAPGMWQIGTDGGYLDRAVRIGKGNGASGSHTLFLMPGERADIVVDFTGQRRGTKILLKNVANAPFPDGEPVNPKTTARIMQFRVKALRGADRSLSPANRNGLGRKKIVRLADPETGRPARGVTIDRRRQLTLNEIMGMPVTANGIAYPGGSLQLLLNNTRWSGESDRAYADFTPVTMGTLTNLYSEQPREGETEVWEIVNLTQDAHPIHLHLVQFQIMNRQPFDQSKYAAAYNSAFPGGQYLPAFGPPLDYRADQNPVSGGKDGGNPDVNPFLQGKAEPPAPNEAGWKDTVFAPPGQVTRLIMRWGPTDLPADTPAQRVKYAFEPGAGGGAYVWHCHILDHEDNEMMRPLSVQSEPGTARTFVLGTDY